MSEEFAEDIDFKAAADAHDDSRAFVLDINGYEGPLHLLLELARQQKVDLVQISVLELAEQYITFIKTAQDLKIDVAADYLVMAAWLAYLKSRLILPKPEEEDAPSDPDELASHLAFRLQRLEAMRRAAQGLMRLPTVGEDVFLRGAPEGLRSKHSPLWQAELFDVIQAYGSIRSKAAIRAHKLPELSVMSLEDARQRLRRALANLDWSDDNWAELDNLLPSGHDVRADIPRDSVRASSLIASLELAKEGQLEIRQLETFAPIYVRGQAKEVKSS